RRPGVAGGLGGGHRRAHGAAARGAGGRHAGGRGRPLGGRAHRRPAEPLRRGGLAGPHRRRHRAVRRRDRADAGRRGGARAAQRGAGRADAAAAGARRGPRSARLVGPDLVDAALVPLVTGEGLGDERVDDREGLLLAVLTGADADDVGVVVLARQLGRGDVPGERAAHAAHLVRGDLLAVAAATDDDPERTGLGDDGLGGREAERRVVVGGVVGVGAVVDDVVAGRAEVLDEGGLELEARVVGGDVQTHGRHHAASRGLVPRSPGGVRPRGAPPGDTAPMSSPLVDLIPRDALFGSPARAAVRLSPDGRPLSWLAPLDGVLNVWVAPADDPAAARPVTRDAARGIRAYF